MGKGVIELHFHRLKKESLGKLFKKQICYYERYLEHCNEKSNKLAEPFWSYSK